MGLRQQRADAAGAARQLVADPAGVRRVRPRLDDGRRGLRRLRRPLARLPPVAGRGRSTARVLARALVAGGGQAGHAGARRPAQRRRGRDHGARQRLPRPPREHRAFERRSARASSTSRTTTASCSASSTGCSSCSSPRTAASCSTQARRSEAAARYDRFYSTRRLRRLAERRRGSKHADLYQGLRLVMERLGDDDGCPALGLPALGGYLWSGDALSRTSARQSCRTRRCSTPCARSRRSRSAASGALSTTGTSAPRSSARSTSRCSSCTPSSTSTPARSH